VEGGLLRSSVPYLWKGKRGEKRGDRTEKREKEEGERGEKERPFPNRTISPGIRGKGWFEEREKWGKEKRFC